MPVTKELVRAVRRRVTEEPGVLTGQLAKELAANEEDVVMSLPVAMRKKARKSDFAAIWRRMAGWKNVSLYSPRLGGVSGDRARGCGGLARGALCPVLRNRAALPEGRDFFERTGRAVEPLVGSIWFVSMPMPGGRRSSVRLYGADGGHVLSVCLGGERFDVPDSETEAEFHSLWSEFGVTPVPKICCKGKRCSGLCGCGHKAVHGHGGRVA